MGADAVQRRLELLKLCHHPSLELERVIERAEALERWMLGDSPATTSTLQRAEELLTGTPKGSV